MGEAATNPRPSLARRERLDRMRQRAMVLLLAGAPAGILLRAVDPPLIWLGIGALLAGFVLLRLTAWRQALTECPLCHRLAPEEQMTPQDYRCNRCRREAATADRAFPVVWRDTADWH